MFPYVSAVGMPKEALDTPALLVDLEKMGRNIARMASTMRDNQVDWRPHVKCPKVPGHCPSPARRRRHRRHLRQIGRSRGHGRCRH